MGPNFFIWIAIGLVVVTTIPAFFGHYSITVLGWVVAITLAVFNKLRAIRRRGAHQAPPIRVSMAPLGGVLIGVATWQAMMGRYIIAASLVAGAVAIFVVQMIRARRWRRGDQLDGFH